MALIYGRRRLGKTYLLQRFIADAETPRIHAYYLADQSTVATQRASLAAEVLAALPVEGVTPEELAISWNAIFRHVSSQCRSFSPGERFGLVLDEFPYLVQGTPELPSILQAWWDREGVHSPILVILCGSQLSTMAALGAETAPLFGRFDGGILRLEPLRYDDAACFYQGSAHYGLTETLTMYGVLGGTPRYHAMVDVSQPMADEIVDLLLRPRAPLENEVGFLLGSEQIRDPAPHNAILRAIAHGDTQFGQILNHTGIERGPLSFHLRTLLELGWVQRERPFGEVSERRALYRLADPFLRFWYRFVAPLSSALQFGDPTRIYADRVAPYLADYMGWHAFEEICHQWFARHAESRMGLQVRSKGRWWSRDGRLEVDLVAEAEGDRFILGECKWSARRPLGISAYADLIAKSQALPEDAWKRDPTYVLFSVGGLAPELKSLAAELEGKLHLVGPGDLLPA